MFFMMLESKFKRDCSRQLVIHLGSSRQHTWVEMPMTLRLQVASDAVCVTN